MTSSNIGQLPEAWFLQKLNGFETMKKMGVPLDKNAFIHCVKFK